MTQIDFFVRALGFELVEDVPSLTNDGRPKLTSLPKPLDLQSIYPEPKRHTAAARVTF